MHALYRTKVANCEGNSFRKTSLNCCNRCWRAIAILSQYFAFLYPQPYKLAWIQLNFQAVYFDNSKVKMMVDFCWNSLGGRGSNINFLFLNLKVFSYPLQFTLLSNNQGCPRSMWHAVLRSTSHQTLSLKWSSKRIVFSNDGTVKYQT